MKLFVILLLLMLALAYAIPFLASVVSLNHAFILALLGFSLLFFKKAPKLLRFLLKPLFLLLLLAFVGWLLFTALKFIGVS